MPLIIKDLTQVEKLNSRAMSAVRGGLGTSLGVIGGGVIVGDNNNNPTINVPPSYPQPKPKYGF